MEVLQSKNSRYEDKQKYLRRTANICFALFFFFVFFGTAIPFREYSQEVEDISSSNIVNQIVFTLLFLVSILTLIPKVKEIKTLVITEKFFSIFLFWCFCSIFWSSYTDVSFKRYIQYLTTFTVIVATLIYNRNSEQLLVYFKVLLGVYVIVSIASVLAIPGAKDRYGIWQGLATSKNHLGMMSVIAALFFGYFFIHSSLKAKLFYFVLLSITLVLFIGSDSFTSLLSVIIVLCFLFLLQIDEIAKPLAIGNFLSVFIILSILGFFLLVIFVFPEILVLIFGSGGKDMTLTGRTDLWADLYIYVKDHIVFGCGYQGFWVVDSPQMQDIYSTFIWLPNQAHNGYIDITNETGIIGLLIFIIMIIRYFILLSQQKTKVFWNWFIVVALIINITESTLIRPRIPIGVMFLFSYLAFFSDRIKLNTRIGNA